MYTIPGQIYPLMPNKRKMHFSPLVVCFFDACVFDSISSSLSLHVSQVNILQQQNWLYNYNNQSWFDISKRQWCMNLTREFITTNKIIDDHIRTHVNNSIVDFLLWHPDLNTDILQKNMIIGLTCDLIKDNSYYKNNNLERYKICITLFSENKEQLLDIREKYKKRLTDLHEMFCTRKNSKVISTFRGRTKKDKVDDYFYKITPPSGSFHHIIEHLCENISKMPFGMRYMKKAKNWEILCMDRDDAIMIKLNHDNMGRND